MRLKDKSGGIEGKVWENAVEFDRQFKKGDIIFIRALNDAFVDPEEPTVFRQEGHGRMSLGGYVQFAPGQWGLTLVEEPHRLLITTIEKTEEQLTTEVYPVGDLLLSCRRRMTLCCEIPTWITAWPPSGGFATSCSSRSTLISAKSRCPKSPASFPSAWIVQCCSTPGRSRRWASDGDPITAACGFAGRGIAVLVALRIRD